MLRCPSCQRRFRSPRALGAHRGQVPACRESDAALLDRKVPHRPRDGCWLWAGHWNDSNGRLRYGVLTRDGASWMAHRWVYTLLRGPIEPDHDLHHICRHTLCVNPDHLVSMTRSDHNHLTHGEVSAVSAAIAAGQLPEPW